MSESPSPTPLRAEILERLQRIARHDLEHDGAIELHMSLKNDLQLDSMGMITVAVGLENAFRIRLDEADAGELLTVSDLVRLVERRVTEMAEGEAL